MIHCRKEAPEMTALATRLTRCHLIQLHCWAKMNSLMVTSALFIFFIYIFTLVAFVPLSPLFFYSFLTVLMDLFKSSLFFPMWQQSEYHQFARKLVHFISVITDMRGGWGCIWNLHTCSLLVSLKPVGACSVNRFAKKPWHDLLSPRQFTSCQI